MMQLHVCKTFTFHAAHRLPFHDGKCFYEHGHTYKAEICVRGEVQAEHPDNPESGMVLDFGKLSYEWKSASDIYGLDHRNLNDLLPNPTAENLCLWLVEYFQQREELYEVVLTRVRVHETDTSYVEWNQNDYRNT